MSKNIVEGTLVEVSPSMISTFDGDSAFGCERRGWFKYVAGLPEQVTGNQALGTSLHKLIEQRLKSCKKPEVVDNEAAGLYLAGESMIEEIAARNILSVEEQLCAFEIAGVKLKGFIDVVTEDGIVDWKTTSDINKYGKTAEELTTDTQMILYAKSVHPRLSRVSLAHGQFQTRGRAKARLVETSVTQGHIDKQINDVIIPAVNRIKEVATFTTAEQATPTRTKCFSCAFRAHCSTDEANTVKSFFKSFVTASGDSSVNLPAPVIPPDAPHSKLELAAEIQPPAQPELREELGFPPVVTTTTTDAPKRRGRPPKSAPSAALASEQGQVIAPAPASAVDSGALVKAVTVSRGFTVNLGQFNSARFDVSVTGEGSDFEATYALLMKLLQVKLDAEAAKFTAESEKGKFVPANTLVAK